MSVYSDTAARAAFDEQALIETDCSRPAPVEPLWYWHLVPVLTVVAQAHSKYRSRIAVSGHRLTSLLPLSYHGGGVCLGFTTVKYLTVNAGPCRRPGTHLHRAPHAEQLGRGNLLLVQLDQSEPDRLDHSLSPAPGIQLDHYA